MNTLTRSILMSLLVLAFAAPVCAIHEEHGMRAGEGDTERGKFLFEQVGFGGGTSEKSCASCHPDGRGLEGVAEKFQGKEAALMKAVNGCIKAALYGKGIPEDSQAMADVIAYLRSLKKH
jgi:cytochrome c